MLSLPCYRDQQEVNQKGDKRGICGKKTTAKPQWHLPGVTEPAFVSDGFAKGSVCERTDIYKININLVLLLTVT